jgi:hypothetical protein
MPGVPGLSSNHWLRTLEECSTLYATKGCERSTAEWSSGGSTRLRFSETGFREKGWHSAVLEDRYREHVTGWDDFLPRLDTYVARLVSTS